MFKSIEYKLLLWLTVMAISCGALAWGIAGQRYYTAAVAVLGIALALNRMFRHYRKFNDNILFLLNALDNGDLSFHFSTTKLSRRERELNQLLNRLKEILANARLEVMDNEKFLGIIIESVATGIVIAEPNDSVRVANRAAMGLLGLSNFTHLKQLAWLDGSYYRLFCGMEPGKSAQIRVANEREELLISVSVTVVTVGDVPLRIFSLTNIGNELEAREMESWIKLIRVMTHEIMNSIAPITSLSETLLETYAGERPGEDEELYENTVEAFRTINSTARGLLSFVESYRKFSGVARPEPLPVDLGALVSRTAALEVPGMRAKGITLLNEVPEHSTTVLADQAKVRQVLVNLLKNAAEAVVGKPDAQVRIGIVRETGGVSLEVRNNGGAVPEEILPHIFVPFFTTKETGTGIGLSLSRYIMRLHGGNLKYRRVDGWTVFGMTFPAASILSGQESM